MTHLKSSFDTIALEFIHFCFTLVIQPDIPTNTTEELCNGLVAGSQVTTRVVQSLLKLHVTLLYTFHGWVAYGVLLNWYAHCRFLFLAPFYNSPDGWVGITYQLAQGLAVIFSHHQVCIKKKKGGHIFWGPKVKVEFRHLFSLQKRFMLIVMVVYLQETLDNCIRQK